MKLQIFSGMLHKLRIIEQKLTKEFEDKFGFSLTRYEILNFLKENGDKTQVEISQYLDIDPAAITRHIKILETKGYVEKKRNESNAREVIVTLTAFAKTQLNNCKNTQNEDENLLSLSMEEIKSLNEILEKIENKINNK